MQAQDLKLEIVSLNNVFLHEEIEHQRVAKLVERLRTDRVLKNPPIVAAVQDSAAHRYIVLDGASRTSALRALNVRDVIVQIVDYHSPELKLESWNHLLLDFTPERLTQVLDGVSCISQIELQPDAAQRELDARHLVAYLKFTDGRVIGLQCSNDPDAQTRALNEIVHAYEGKVELFRAASTDLTELVSPSQTAAVMVFPRYQPDEIIHLALNGTKVPMGITRHIIPGRALRVNLPLDLLESTDSLAQKNEWLAQWRQEKIKTRQVRYYQEPVFLFDE